MALPCCTACHVAVSPSTFWYLNIVPANMHHTPSSLVYVIHNEAFLCQQLHDAAICWLALQVMFLAEAALGKEHHIVRDDPSLTTAPAGFHSVVAKGQTEPDPAQDARVDLDGNSVHVAQGKPVQAHEFKNSNFMQSEYLLYQESQARIRYMLTMKFSHAGCWH